MHVGLRPYFSAISMQAFYNRKVKEIPGQASETTFILIDSNIENEKAHPMIVKINSHQGVEKQYPSRDSYESSKGDRFMWVDNIRQDPKSQGHVLLWGPTCNKSPRPQEIEELGKVESRKWETWKLPIKGCFEDEAATIEALDLVG